MAAQLKAGVDTLVLIIDQPTEDGIPRDDLIGVKVWYSTTSGFNPPTQGVLAFDGQGLNVTITGLTSGTTYYVKYALISEIDPDSYEISAQLSGVPLFQSATVDTIAPPTPFDITASSAITSVNILQTAPTYTQGRGHDITHVYGVQVATGSTYILPTFTANTPKIGEFRGNVWSFPSDPNTTWHLWFKWQSKDGVFSVEPYGGLNGIQVVTSEDITRLLDRLENEITESQLSNSLNTRLESLDNIQNLVFNVSRGLNFDEYPGTEITENDASLTYANSILTYKANSVNSYIKHTLPDSLNTYKYNILKQSIKNIGISTGTSYAGKVYFEPDTISETIYTTTRNYFPDIYKYGPILSAKQPNGTNFTTIEWPLNTAGRDVNPVSTFTNPNLYFSSDGDYFNRIAANNKYLIVGAFGEETSSTSNSGVVYVYEHATENLLYTFENPNPVGTSLSDSFGISVAVYENTLAVGAWTEDAADNLTGNAGKVYIYDLQTGTLTRTINNPATAPSSNNNYFGISVALYKNHCLIGAQGAPGLYAGTSSSGKAYLYDLTTGQFLFTFENPNIAGTQSQDNFGSSVAIYDRFCAIGARWEDSNGFTDSGAVYIFNTESGSNIASIQNPNLDSNEGFGNSLSIYENFLLIGAPFYSGNSQVGRAYLYDIQKTNSSSPILLWTINNPLSPAQASLFGSSVSIGENYLVIGSPRANTSAGTQSGQAYVYNYITKQLIKTLNNPNIYSTAEYDNFGSFVVISGNDIFIGASAEDDINTVYPGIGSGVVYKFTPISVISNKSQLFSDRSNAFIQFSTINNVTINSTTGLASSSSDGTVTGSVRPVFFTGTTSPRTFTTNTPITLVNTSILNFNILKGGYNALTGQSWGDTPESNEGIVIEYSFDNNTWNSIIQISSTDLVRSNQWYKFSTIMPTAISSITAPIYLRIRQVAFTTGTYSGSLGFDCWAICNINVISYWDSSSVQNIKNLYYYLTEGLGTIEIDWLSIGNVGVDEYTNTITNLIKVESETRQDADDNLFAQYTVKIDQNGYVSGFGLASETVNGTPRSQFQVRADSFSITNPAVTRTKITEANYVTNFTNQFSTGIINHGLVVGDKIAFQNVLYKPLGAETGPWLPLTDSLTVTQVFQAGGNYSFQVVRNDLSQWVEISTQDSWVSKVSVPFIIQDGKTYIDTAIIKDASIQSAKIANLDATKITSGLIDVARLGALSITAEKIAVGTITADKISANEINVAKINSNSLNVTEYIDRMTANIGDQIPVGQFGFDYYPINYVAAVTLGNTDCIVSFTISLHSASSASASPFFIRIVRDATGSTYDPPVIPVTLYWDAYTNGVPAGLRGISLNITVTDSVATAGYHDWELQIYSATQNNNYLYYASYNFTVQELRAAKYV